MHFCKDNVKTWLCSLYYAAATKEEIVSNEPITLESLTEIDVEHRELALDLIVLPTNAELINLDVTTLLRHPVFTLWSAEGRSRLVKELQIDEEIRIWKNKEKFEEWEHSLEKNKIPHEEFDDLKDVVSIDDFNGQGCCTKLCPCSFFRCFQITVTLPNWLTRRSNLHQCYFQNTFGT